MADTTQVFVACLFFLSFQNHLFTGYLLPGVQERECYAATIVMSRQNHEKY